ncbi:EpsG family protein [Riemerella anatipestifer]
MAYIVIAIFLLLLNLMELLKYNKQFSRLLMFFGIAILLLFVGLRDGSIVGIDSPAYYANYLLKYWEVEYGYRYMNNLFSSNGINYNIFLLVINAISLYNISRFIKFSSPYLLFPIFIYFSDFFLYYNFSGIRQALSLSFTSLAIVYTYRSEKVKAFLLIVCGAFFHITALVFMVCFVVPHKKMTTINYMKFLGMILVGAFVSYYLIENIEYLRYKFIYYSELQEKSENIQTAYIIGILKRSILFIGVFLVRNSFFQHNINVFLFNVYLIGFVVYISTYLVSPDFGVRFSSYFTIVDCILIGNILWVCRRRDLKVILYLLFTLMAMYKVYTYTEVEAYEYRFFLD